MDSLDYYADAGLSAVFYDVLTAHDASVQGDVDYYATRIGPPSARVLELGCGTGRVALPLAGQGYEVTGIDLADAMLARAERKRQALPAEVAARLRFQKGDMTALDLGESFDAVLIPFYGLNHLADAEARRAALSVMARHLRPGGVGIAHAMAPEMVRTPLAADDASRKGVTLRFDPTERRLRLKVLDRTIDQAARRSVQTVEYAVLDEQGRILRQSAERLAYGWFDDAEVEAAASAVGLTLVGTDTGFSDESKGHGRVYRFVRAG